MYGVMYFKIPLDIPVHRKLPQRNQVMSTTLCLLAKIILVNEQPKQMSGKVKTPKHIRMS